MDKDGIIVITTMIFTYFLVIICLYKIKNGKQNRVSVNNPEDSRGISFQLTEIRQDNPPDLPSENRNFTVIRDIPNIVNP